MEKFKIVTNNLSELSMKTQEGDSIIESVPVLMQISKYKAVNENFYEAEIKVKLSKQIRERAALDIELKFAPLVFVLESEENVDEIMKEYVPRCLFNSVRVLVWNLSSEADMPLMLSDDDLLVSKTCDDPRDEQSVTEPTAQKSAIGDIVKTFKDLPIYDCYYKYITPVKYNHPDIKECDEELWVVLYQLLYGSFNMDCDLVEVHEGLLDIHFCDDEGHAGYISELTLYELEVLILHLWTSLGKDMLSLVKSDSLNEEVYIECEEGELISKEDFLSLYNIDEDDFGNSLSSMLEKMYDKIVKADAQSFPYRF